mmetsp:Transcript_18041/g.28236  ORF Transcript_18041/g.28236 Transcript_18041/m.28236 type:complete len:337 (-) Transcript_18041:177-1187(-)|eukprot:CAMPEP_0201531082 /NCGR_PEP_ID=MMETSP0161_2-20130828/46575_1 /ASSEMBLY_ACC=CAM_ASM_000251 /TAXON_ID=180227 /ORGANISM="Neoparamoeba aestuarina, Strain SoJaBio B1-5/56/2" /LENGTH=336 /DNA_ID=CAMNT_0047933761 /DNA_START=77 /DNA_END=1087 /DNA_ORIENTATION=-
MGGKGFFVPFVALVVVLGFLVERGEAQNGIKHLKIYIEDIRRREVYACFPKGYHSALDPDIYRPRDQTNYATGFLGEFVDRVSNELYDCDDLFQQDIRIDVWGCDLVTIETDIPGLQSMFNFRFEVVSCDNTITTFGADNNRTMVMRYFEEASTVAGNRIELSPSQSFDFGFETVEQPTMAGYRRQSSTVIGPFGPPSHQANMAQVEIPLLDPSGGGSPILTAQFHIKSYNPCVALARCVEALVSPTFLDVTEYMCPVPACPPGWQRYNQYACYEELRQTPESPAFPANEAANMGTFSGVYDCTGRRVQDAYCFSEVNALNIECAKATVDDFKHYS